VRGHSKRGEGWKEDTAESECQVRWGRNRGNGGRGVAMSTVR